jgi:hypothetical protein
VCLAPARSKAELQDLNRFADPLTPAQADVEAQAKTDDDTLAGRSARRGRGGRGGRGRGRGRGGRGDARGRVGEGDLGAAEGDEPGTGDIKETPSKAASPNSGPVGVDKARSGRGAGAGRGRGRGRGM